MDRDFEWATKMSDDELRRAVSLAEVVADDTENWVKGQKANTIGAQQSERRLNDIDNTLQEVRGLSTTSPQSSARPKRIKLSPGEKAKTTFAEIQAWCLQQLIKSKSEYTRHPNLPPHFPVQPEATCPDWPPNGWYLCTGKRPVNATLAQSQDFAREFNVNSRITWDKAYAEHAKEWPICVPAAPDAHYKDKPAPNTWSGWPAFTGSGYIKPEDRPKIDLAEFRSWLQARNITSSIQFLGYIEKHGRPDNIPSAPAEYYETSDGKRVGWEGIFAKRTKYRGVENVMPYGAASAWARTWAQTHARSEWVECYDRGEMPSDMPKSPYETYKRLGVWISFPHFFGRIRQLDQHSILFILRSLQKHIHTLSASELLAIIQQKGLLDVAEGKTNNTNALCLSKCIKDFLEADDADAATRAIGAFQNAGAVVPSQTRSTSTLEELEDQTRRSRDLTEREVLHSTTVGEHVRRIDDIIADAALTPGDDQEVIDFLVIRAVQRLWDWVLNGKPEIRDGKHILRKNPSKIVEEIRAQVGGRYTEIVRDQFLDWYDGASRIKVPEGYIYRHQPNLMQRLTAYLVQKHRRFGNWSGVGAGKSLSAILTSRILGARWTVIFAHNSTLKGWLKYLGKAKLDDDIRRPPAYHTANSSEQYFAVSDRHRYIIINYEKMSHSDIWLNALREYAPQVDLIVLDEIQLVKIRHNTEVSKRRQRTLNFIQAVQLANPGVAVLGMSATPVINDLMEGKRLLETITGQRYDDMKTKPTTQNINNLHQKLMINGIRYRRRYAQKAHIRFRRIDISSNLRLIKRLREAVKLKHTLTNERILLNVKLRHLHKWLQPGTVIYTHHVDRVSTEAKMIDSIIAKVRSLTNPVTGKPYTCTTYTGQCVNRDTNKDLFENGSIDILVASEPINTGVDGLQHRTTRLIIMSLPWTGSGYEQLIGRFIREGRTIGTLDVIIPRVYLYDKTQYGTDMVASYADNMKGRGKRVWYWDEVRWQKVQYKLGLTNAVVDGFPFDSSEMTKEKLILGASEALEEWAARIESGIIYTNQERTELTTPLLEHISRENMTHYGDMSHEHSWFNTAYSSTVHQEFTNNRARWDRYHALYREARQNWSDIPYQKLAQRSLLAKPGLIIADFGCGEALLRELLPASTVHSFDHVAINEHVIACDIQAVPLPDQSMDRVVCSLSLMSLNFPDYLREAYRVLKVGGFLLVAEARERWHEQGMLQEVIQAGFVLLDTAEYSDRFVYQVAVRIN